jgi:hypothetical protein
MNAPGKFGHPQQAKPLATKHEEPSTATPIPFRPPSPFQLLAFHFPLSTFRHPPSAIRFSLFAFRFSLFAFSLPLSLNLKPYFFKS